MIVVSPLEDRVGALEDEMGYWGQPVDPDRRRQRRAHFEKSLKIPSAAAGADAREDALTHDQVDEILRQIHDVCGAHMPNSSLSQFAQGWLLRINNRLSRLLATITLEAPYIPRLVDLAVRAPGCHDATAFPELDAQPIPRGAHNDYLMAAAEEDDKKAQEEQQERINNGEPAAVFVIVGAEAHEGVALAE